MEFLDPKIDEYVSAHSEDEPLVLKELTRETWLKAINPRMLAGHLQGRTLSMISHMIKPKTVLEIGTFTGYSAICLAEGLAQNGKIITIDINEELEYFAKKYFVKAGIETKIEQRIGDAMELVPSITEELDLVFTSTDAPFIDFESSFLINSVSFSADFSNFTPYVLPPVNSTDCEIPFVINKAKEPTTIIVDKA